MNQQDVNSLMERRVNEPVLCYVKGAWAWFTTQNLADQWGDDWNDAPYEHNAGEPYAYQEFDRKYGREPWSIIKVAWEGDFETPEEYGYLNSPWSVQQINAGAIAWLRTPSWKSGTPIIIPAGTMLTQFCELIRESGGKVYVDMDATWSKKEEAR